MEIKVRQRLVGAVVLAALAIVFIPMFLKGSKPEPRQITLTAEIPPAPPKPTLQQQTSQPSAQTILSQQSNMLAPMNNGPSTTTTISMQPQTQQQLKPASTPAASAQVVLANDSAPIPFSPTAAAPSPTVAKTNAPVVAAAPEPAVAPVIMTTEPTELKQKAKSKPKQKTIVASATPATPKHVVQLNVAKLVDIDDQIKAEQVTHATKKVLAKADEVAKPAPVVVATKPLEKSPAVGGAWIVQLGSFSSAVNAKKLAADLRAKGFSANTEDIKTAKGKQLTRVYIGPEMRHEWAQAVQTKLDTDLHLKGVVVAFEPA